MGGWIAAVELGRQSAAAAQGEGGSVDNVFGVGEERNGYRGQAADAGQQYEEGPHDGNVDSK